VGFERSRIHAYARVESPTRWPAHGTIRYSPRSFRSGALRRLIEEHKMKTFAWLPLAAALSASAAFAQAPAPSPAQPTPPTAQPSPQPAAPMAPAMKPAEPNTTGAVTTRQDANAPLAGANSFTEAQAKSRIEEFGFTSVGQLQKDKDGIWRGTATKDGKSASVALDYRGNVVGQ
jgi:hypothetical protein